MSRCLVLSEPFNSVVVGFVVVVVVVVVVARGSCPECCQISYSSLKLRAVLQVMKQRQAYFSTKTS